MLTALTIPAVTLTNAAQPEGTTIAKATVPVEKVQDAISPVTTQVQTLNGQSTIISPRTGIQYTIPNEYQRPVVLQTEAVVAANSANAKRIVATNPALSEASQQAAVKALVDMAK